MSGGEERVPKGYKQTEVGVIPEDWELKTFGEIFDFKSTASNSRSDLTESDSTHYIHYGDIHTVFHRHLNLEKIDTPMISRELCKNAALVNNGDWVMADASEDYSGICKAIEISGITNESTVVAGLHTFLLRDRVGAYVPGFKGHLGEAKYLHDQYVRVSVGLKVFGVTKTSLRDLFIPVPPKPEQTRIEEILTDSDSQIQALENLIAKKRDIKQGTIQELLTGKTRLPGFSGEWNSSRLGDLLSVMSGKDWKNVAEEFGKFPVLGTGGVMGQSNDYLHDLPCVLIGRKGTIDRPQYMDTPFWCVDTIFFCVMKEYNNAKFLYYMFHMIDWYAYNEASGVPSLNSGTIEKIRVSVPSNSEQEAIAEVLSDMDAEIAALEQRLEKTKAIKQGMMQQLLTGRIRLVDPSTSLEASA